MSRSSKLVASRVGRRAYSSSTVVAQEPLSNTKGRKAMRVWLLTVSGMVFAIVIVGGLTRLTESGLSIVYWKPLGNLPPMNQAEWEAEFEQYKQFPEYKKKNQDMTLQEFKYIFFYEYVHRMIGRAIGLTFVLPATYFWARGYLHKRLKMRFSLITAMIGFQGFLGWYMVASGLDENHELMKKYNSVPRVSQYRLAAHLGAAFAIYATTLWTYFDLAKPRANEAMPQVAPEAASKLLRFKKIVPWVAGLVFVTALSGAFVAGMDAGLVFNEFPLMGDRLIPKDMFNLKPWFVNFFENATTVQFQHRALATLSSVAILSLYLAGKRLPLSPASKRALHALLGMLCIQYTLGISTLLNYVPVSLASAHQAGSLTLFTFSLWLANLMKRMPIK